jgi:regulator of protease activity HflC (stomatin/prohibitin superfamily)
MRFVLEKERQEAERKRIEAQGIQDFQRIVSQGISDQLLRWKGIEATSRLAESNNSKVVIVGGKDGLPLILNTGEEPKSLKKD